MNPGAPKDTRDLAREIAGLASIADKDAGGKRFRISAGQQIGNKKVLGIRAERTVRERGRWGSDIACIYQRALASTHLSGSAAVGDVCGAELEDLCAGWAQPASFR